MFWQGSALQLSWLRLVVACRLKGIMLFIYQNYLSLTFSAILVSKVAVVVAGFKLAQWQPC